MKLQLLNGGLSVKDDAQASSYLQIRIETITRMIHMYNECDWQPIEVAQWLQIQKETALLEAELFSKGYDQ